MQQVACGGAQQIHKGQMSSFNRIEAGFKKVLIVACDGCKAAARQQAPAPYMLLLLLPAGTVMSAQQ
jgi:hypothetical protein